MNTYFLKTGSKSLKVGAALFCLGLAASANADELITNGGFETGSFTGWTVRNADGGDPTGTFAIGNNATDFNLTPPSPATPISELATVGAKSGNYYAVSDSLGPGAHVLLQSFILPVQTTKTIVSFDMFVNDWNGGGVLNQNGTLDPNQLDGFGNVIPTQFARVDLLTASADAFSTDAGDVITNLFNGEDAGIPANDYTHYAFDISPYVTSGSTYQLRFSEVDNQFSMNQGVDNVSVATNPTPEPGSVGLLLGVAITGASAFRRRRRTKS